MKVWAFKGNRIRASDKSLVYHFCIGWLLLLFVAVFLLLNLRQLLVTDWKDFNLLHAGNLVYKAMVHTAKVVNGNILTGTKAPVILTSRSDSVEVKVNSLALGAVVAHSLQQK